jgi:FkbM family methyltransferase
MLINGELRYINQVLPNCSIVFDIGANIGDWTSLALKINPKLCVHCFEPSHATYQRLIGRKFPPSVICNNFGLSSKAETATLHVFAEGSGVNSLYRRRGLEDGWRLETQKCEETVNLEVLDQYCKRVGVSSIDYLKVDVEGHELEVFKGASKLLAGASIKRIQFEYGGCNIDAHVLLRDLFEFFQPFSYDLYKIMPHGLTKVERYDQRLENFNYSNWAVIRKDLEQ